MQRRSALISMASMAGTLAAARPAFAAEHGTGAGASVAAVPNRGKPLRPPARGLVQVAFVVGPELVTIDLFGPMAAFVDAMMPEMAARFNTYTVAETTDRIDLGGVNIQPKFSFAEAPQPHVLVVPMQKALPATIAWIQKASARADVTMSVCTGAFLVARAGLFDGLKATTHHGAYDAFQQMYPSVTLIRGPRYVEQPNVSSSGGESSGIDLALRVVERYYGANVANAAAYNMEYRRTPRPQSIAAV